MRLNELPPIVSKNGCEWTGQVDRKGNKIYDQDIVIVEGYVGNDAWILKVERSKITGKYTVGGDELEADYYEHRLVVGNVIDNPEYLTDYFADIAYDTGEFDFWKRKDVTKDSRTED